MCINHFLINNNWYLVDLPGYGCALCCSPSVCACQLPTFDNWQARNATSILNVSQHREHFHSSFPCSCIAMGSLLQPSIYSENNPSHCRRRYAKRSKDARLEFAAFTQAYFLERPSLASVLVLVDASVPPQKADLEVVDWLTDSEVMFPHLILVFRCVSPL